MADLYYDHPRYGLRGSNTVKGELMIRYGEPLLREETLLPALLHYYRVRGGLMPVQFVSLADRFYLPFEVEMAHVDYATYLAPQSYYYESPGRWLGHSVHQAGFRGASSLTRQEVYLAVPVDSLGDATDLEVEVVAFDSGWVETARSELDLPVAKTTRAGRGARALVHQLEFVLAPGSYHLATLLRSPDGTLQGNLTQEIEVRDFAGSELTMSDLELAFATGGPHRQRFKKGRAPVIPNATRVFEDQELLFVYFDIYNLRLEDGRGHYQLSYRIRPAPRHGDTLFGRLLDAMRLRTFVEARIIEESAGATASRYLGIDIDGLPADQYDLTVAVTDLRTGEATARTVRFERRTSPS
jgi:hypothetical protein